MSLNQKSLGKKVLEEKSSAWFSTTELLEYLGISDAELNQQLSIFTKGIHYKYEKEGDSSSQILWRIELVDELLCLPVPPLEREAMLQARNNHITCKR